MKKFEELIERLGKEGPSRELDARIKLARRQFLFGLGAVTGAVIGGAVPEGWIGGISYQPVKAPLYTSSIDAALTLVPKGLYWEVHQDNCALVRGPNGHDYIGWQAASPAIALCIAALRALASTDGGWE